jgi:hypothetical protein
MTENATKGRGATAERGVDAPSSDSLFKMGKNGNPSVSSAGVAPPFQRWKNGEATHLRTGEEQVGTFLSNGEKMVSEKAKRPGRPSGFRPEIGAALIDLTINEGLPIKHAARRLGVGVRTVYDWLERARNEGAAPELVEWVREFRVRSVPMEPTPR